MSEVLGYFGDLYGTPISYINKNGLVVFSNKKSLKKYKYLGSYSEMNKILSNLDYYMIHKNQNGGGGLFGESQGSCGWGSNPSCCFFSCEPMWKTSLWPISDVTM